MKKKIKIIVACHKDSDSIRHDDIYMPVQVGKTLHPEVNLGFQADDEGDNISNKNKSFCELTAIYWAWKNLKDVDYIGLCHYRRYFNFSKSNILPYTEISDDNFSNIDLNNAELSNIISKNKIILAKPIIYPMSLFDRYSLFHISDDFRTLLDIIDEFDADNSLQIRNYLLSNNKFSAYNMFIMPWKEFDEYCSWLFPILFEAEKRININNYNDVQKRIFGYLAERLLNAYVYCKKMNVSLYPIYYVKDEPHKVSPVRWIINNLRCAIIHKLLYSTSNNRER